MLGLTDVLSDGDLRSRISKYYPRRNNARGLPSIRRELKAIEANILPIALPMRMMRRRTQDEKGHVVFTHEPVLVLDTVGDEDTKTHTIMYYDGTWESGVRSSYLKPIDVDGSIKGPWGIQVGKMRFDDMRESMVKDLDMKKNVEQKRKRSNADEDEHPGSPSKHTKKTPSN